MLSKQIVCYGEILWDILPGKSLPGGAPMNVAYHLKKLGLEPNLVTRVGLDDHGQKLVNILAGYGLATEFFQIDYNHPTGIVYARLGDHNEVNYDIVYPSAWDFIQWDPELETLIQGSQYFVFGSLTSRSQKSRETLYQLLSLAKTKVLDINLRPPHFQRTHIEYLLNKANVLKMNISELELITGWFTDYHSIDDRIRLIQDRFKIETIIVTMGGEGAMVMQDGKTYKHSGYKVKVSDTIGSGDSFLAGFLYQIINGHTYEEALTYASAIGAFVATRAGACPEYNTNEIITLMESSKTAQSNIS